jgi:hypothetical protein
MSKEEKKNILRWKMKEKRKKRLTGRGMIR